MTETIQETATAPVAPETTPVEQTPIESTAPAAENADQAEIKTEEAAASDDGEDSADESRPKKKGGGFQNRIDKITREKYEAEIRASDAERKLAELTTPKDDPNAPSGDEPKLDSGKYATVEEWSKAHGEWAERKGYQKAIRESDQQRQEREALAARATIEAKQALTAQKHPDYYVAIAPVAPFIMNNPVLKQFVVESDLGTDVAYHLAKNPAKLDEITRMSPIAAGRELYRLESKLAASPPPKPITKAADPIKPVGANEKVSRSYEEMSMEEYARRRREEHANTKDK